MALLNVDERSCEYCKKLFKPSERTQRYCCVACRYGPKRQVFSVRGDVATTMIRRVGTNEFLEVVIDACEVPRASQCSWKISTWGYMQNGRGKFFHRLLMNPDGDSVVDHLNGNKLDNRRVNLRVTSQLVNTHNRQKRMPKNVHFAKQIGKWRVRFYYNWKSHGFGCYDSKQEAEAVAAEVRRKLLRGEPIEGNHKRFGN